MKITIPAHKNSKLKAVAELVHKDREIGQLYKCVNINAVDRTGMPDHGAVHIRIVTNIALRILRLLHQNEVQTGVEKDYEMEYDDAEVIVFLASLLHDIGMSVHREGHEAFSIALAAPIIDRLLSPVYEPDEVIILRSEILHAMIAHNGSTKCYTVEAGVVKVADALDMTEGRSRIAFEAGEINIYSVSSLAVHKIEILQGAQKPIMIKISMHNSAGIFQVDELLKRKLANSSIRDLVEIEVLIGEGKEKKIVSGFKF
ncbi:phosphohydrolase [Candidatus Wirthbacteria bacterium CG2_30_54_11]|uniref:Phosphohydrolase n=1 Tax=Candidatus Wirthbacteria bacterium CG2_30_54_11 TaxID=1817892 RepID=A0A1J5INJ9_9BACT|nr:MAG: phosphohydrolase [Candidatus Wirthbacteria bacterium CG2_30_54_11]